MKRQAILAAISLSVLASGSVLAQEPQGLSVTPEEFEAKLGYQHGTVELGSGMAAINVPESMRFIGPEGSRRLLTEAWGNPPELAVGVLGMLIPAEVSPLAPEGWGVIITYDEDGYVKDDDAASIDYGKMLKELQEATLAANPEREKAGYPPMTLVGWAEPPSYDAAAHKLYWAKELASGDEPEHTLNYNIRILGRRGVLVLNAVARMEELGVIRDRSQEMLAAVEFKEGHRYAEYLPGTDKAATYGITGLIAGAAAAKAGLFKLLWVGILAFKKLIIVGVVALGSMLKPLFSRWRKPAPAASAQP